MGLMGCVYIPTARQTMYGGQPRPESLLGKASSSKPLKFGQTSIVDAIQLLQKTSRGWSGPIDGNRSFYASKTKREIGVQYSVIAGRFFTICGVFDDPKDRLLLISFNEAGFITGYRTLGEWDTGGNDPIARLTSDDAERLFGKNGRAALQDAGLLLTDAQLQQSAEQRRQIEARDRAFQEQREARSRSSLSSQPSTAPWQLQP